MPHTGCQRCGGQGKAGRQSGQRRGASSWNACAGRLSEGGREAWLPVRSASGTGWQGQPAIGSRWVPADAGRPLMDARQRPCCPTPLHELTCSPGCQACHTRPAPEPPCPCRRAGGAGQARGRLVQDRCARCCSGTAVRSASEFRTRPQAAAAHACPIIAYHYVLTFGHAPRPT